MKYAATNSIPFLGTGGGHAYTTTVGSVQNGIDMDLGNFYEVEIDAEANTMTVGANVHFANVTAPLYAAGREFRKHRSIK